jgi:hypothetical protein
LSTGQRRKLRIPRPPLVNCRSWPTSTPAAPAARNVRFRAVEATFNRSPPDVIPRPCILLGRRWLAIGIGTRVFRKVRRGQIRPSRGVSSHIGTRRARRGVHIAHLISLVDDRLGPRLSPRYVVRRMLTGSTIADIVVGPQILPVTAQVALGIATKVTAIAADVGPVTSRIVAAQILPVGVKVSPISLEIPLIGANIGAVAGDVAFVVGAIALLGAAIGAACLLIVRRIIVAAQVLPVGAKVGLIPLKVLLISTDVGAVASDVALIAYTIALLGTATGVARLLLTRSAALNLSGGSGAALRGGGSRSDAAVVAAQILPVGAKVGLISLKILLISTDVGSVAGDVAFVVGAVALVGTAIVFTRLLLVRSLLVRDGALRRDGSRSALALRLGSSRRGAVVVVTTQILPIRTKVGLISPKVVLISTNIGLVAGDVAFIVRSITIDLVCCGVGRRGTGLVIVGVGLRQRRAEN